MASLDPNEFMFEVPEVPIKEIYSTWSWNGNIGPLIVYK